MKWWTRIFGGGQRGRPAAPVGTETVAVRREVVGGQGIVTVDLDTARPESRAALDEEIVRQSGFPLFEGQVEHGYAQRMAATTEKCPRCGAPTRRCTANFIYATNIATRAMLAPAGWFCTACPTVIVDEELIAHGAKQGCQFRCVVGIDYGGRRPPDPFRTWNGKQPVYIFDEHEQITDMVMRDQLQGAGGTPFPPKDRAKEKRKRQLAAQSRRRNRR